MTFSRLAGWRATAHAVPRKVWLHRGRAAVWLAVGVATFAAGVADSVVLVWAASVYANVVSDWGAGEAADDREVTGRLEVLTAMVTDLAGDVRALRDQLTAGGWQHGPHASCPRCSADLPRADPGSLQRPVPDDAHGRAERGDGVDGVTSRG